MMGSARDSTEKPQNLRSDEEALEKSDSAL